MAVTAADFYQFARRIADTATAEIDHRNAISRVYYAGYHAAMAVVARAGTPFTPEKGHSEFCAQLLAQPKGSPLRSLGFALNYLRQSRNAADYGLNRHFGANDTATAFGGYSNVMRLLGSLTE